MSKPKKKKPRRGKPLSEEDRLRRVERECRRAFSAVGILRKFDALPRGMQRDILQLCNPKADVQVDASLRNDPVARKVQKGLSGVLNECGFDVVDGPPEEAGRRLNHIDPDLFFQDYLSYVFPATRGLTALKDTPGQPFPADWDRLFDRAAELAADETFLEVMSELITEMDHVLAFSNRVDSRLYWVDWELRNLRNYRRGTTFRVRKKVPSRVTVELDGERRPAYRCGQSVGPDLDWVTWTASQIGLGEVRKEFPVYIQAHALRRLSERLDTLQAAEGMLHDNLWLSLSEPVFAGRKGADLLVEYRFYGRKLGYLPTAITADKAIVRTFLFVTMDGSPEGQQLYERLRLTGKERAHLQWDRLSTLVETDLREDPDLKEILRECGCGEIFDMSLERVFTECKTGFAAEARKYLGMERKVPSEKLAASLQKQWDKEPEDEGEE